LSFALAAVFVGSTGVPLQHGAPLRSLGAAQME
jgi:hypothetical protein